jgi:sporulation protein YqfC
MKKGRGLEPIKNFLKADILSREATLNVRGTREMSVYACVGLSEYTKERDGIKTVDGMVFIIGEELELKSFSTGEVKITGEIRDIHLSGEVEII